MSYFEIFKREIINHSVSNTYDEACSEWDEICVDEADGDDYECICSHPIKQLITIRNRENNNETIVGCDCIQKITGMKNKDLYLPALTNLIELKHDPENTTLGKNLIEFIKTKDILDDRHIAFLQQMRCKRRLSEKQELYYNGLKGRIVRILGRRSC
jgi:hypothetical protein